MSRRTPPPRPIRRRAPRVRPARGATARSRSGSSRRPPARRAAQQRSGSRSRSRSGSRSGSTARRQPARHGSRSRAGTARSSTRPPARRERRTVTLREAVRKPSRRHESKPRRSIKRRVVTAKHRPERRRFSAGSPATRLRILLVMLLVVLGAVLFKVAQVQSAGGEALRAAGEAQWTRTRTLSADRGAIFDRNGEELAMSIPAYSISVNPKLVVDEAGTARTLQALVGLDDQATLELYDEMVRKDRGFVYVERQVDLAVGEQIARLGLSGVNVDPEDRRILPGGDTGRSVIGLTDIDGTGIAGLEKQYHELLAGVPGEMSREVDPGGRSIAGTQQVTSLPVPGNDLVLTLDRSIQFATEQALVKRVTEIGAQAGTVIVMDTDTGDVFAMASVARRDADEEGLGGTVEITSGNHAAVNAYEPGSVAKVITIAAGLNQGAVTPDSTFVVPWRRQYADDLLKDSHEHPDELMTVEQILVESSNIGTIDVQVSLDADWDTARQTHWEYMRRFGLGERTALGFPGESAGILKHWTDLWGSERVTVAYGQGVASTSIQLAAAVNTIANDGTYVAPRLVKGTVDAHGEITEAEPSATREVIRPDVAAEVQDMMRSVVCRGTATRAQTGIENFSVAGKTGTGLKAQPNGGYRNEEGELVYYASFVGFFPAEDPQVTVLVSIDEPPAGNINRFGGTAAAPVFAQLAPTIMHELGMQPPDDSTPCPVRE